MCVRAGGLASRQIWPDFLVTITSNPGGNSHGRREIDRDPSNRVTHVLGARGRPGLPD